MLSFPGRSLRAGPSQPHTKEKKEKGKRKCNVMKVIAPVPSRIFSLYCFNAFDGHFIYLFVLHRSTQKKQKELKEKGKELKGQKPA